jgi:hypothetical protein
MTVNKPKVASSKWKIASINNPEGGQHLNLKRVQTRKMTAFQSIKELENKAEMFQYSHVLECNSFCCYICNYNV